MDDAVILSYRTTDTVETDEAALIHAARTEPDAFGELCSHYSSRLYSYLRARTNNDDDAADLAQQVFLKAMVALPHYQDRGISFGAWLFHIARNALMDKYRRRRQTISWDLVPESLVPATSGNSLEEQVLQDEARARIRALMGDLDADERELILLRFVGELTLREIAAVTGESESAVHRHIRRILRTMRERYSDK